MAIEVKDVTLKELLSLTEQKHVRRVLLTDYATVEPKQRDGEFVLLGITRVVATVFDRDDQTIYRWSEDGESERMVTVVADACRGPNASGRLTARKEQVFQVLREEGLEVDE